MELKKGLYFTIDGIISAAIILALILLVSPFYIKQTSITNLNFLSQDFLNVFSTIKFKDTNNPYIKNNPYINGLISSQIINKDNAILQQVAEFWASSQMDYAHETVRIVMEPWVPNATGYGVWVNNDMIYQRDMPVKNSLVSSKKMISGIAKGQTSQNTRKSPPTLWGPAIVEVRVWQ